MPATDSDVKLLPHQVKIEAWDVCLDSKDRRKNNTPQRRALVHDFGDRLTLNWGKDYPSGVKIEGDTVVNGDLDVTDGLLTAQVHVLKGWEFLCNPPAIHLIASELVLHNKELQEKKRNVALAHMEGDVLTINHKKGYEGGVRIEGDVKITEDVHIEGNLVVKREGLNIAGGPHMSLTMDIVQELLNLRKEVKELKAEIAKLK